MPPETVQIGPYTYCVTLVDAEVDDGETGVQLGNLNLKSLEISLDRDQSPAVMADTLLHEVLHGILTQTGAVQGDEQEQVVTALSSPLLDTLRRNPALVAYLIGEA